MRSNDAVDGYVIYDVRKEAEWTKALKEEQLQWPNFKSINKDRDLRRGNGRRSIFYAELLKCEEEEIPER